MAKKTFTKYPNTYVKASNSAKTAILDKYMDTDTWIKARLRERAYFRRGYKNDIYWIKILDIGEAPDTYIINKVSAYKEYKGTAAQRDATLANAYTVAASDISIINPIETATDDDIFGSIKLSKAKIAEIYEYLDDTYYTADFDQAIENVAEQFGLSKSQANSIVWDWTIEIKDDEDEEP